MTDYEKCGGALWPQKKKLYSKCLRCGRALKNEQTQERGFGDVCWKKHLMDKQTTMF